MDPKDEELYNKCKYTVKLWEHNFIKANKRLPSKLDIKEASSEVRKAYKTYFELKTNALEQSFKDVDGFNSEDDSVEFIQKNLPETSEIENKPEETFPCSNEVNKISEDNIENENFENVWGLNLNKKVTQKPEEKKVSTVSSLVKKLYRSGSSTFKKTSRKSLKTLSQSKSETITENNTTITTVDECNSVPEKDNTQDDFSIISDNSFKIVEKKTEKCAQSTNIIQSVLNNQYKTKIVDSNWVKRINDSTYNMGEVSGTQHVEENFAVDYNSDDIVVSSEDENLHCSKKAKFDSTTSIRIENTQPTNRLEPIKEQQSVDSIPKTDEKKDLQEKAIIDESDTEDDKDMDYAPAKVKNKRTKSTEVKKVRGRKKKETASSKKSVEPSKKKTGSRKQNNSVSDDSNDETTYELEFSIKTRKSTPRFNSIKEILKTKTKSLDSNPSESLVKNKNSNTLEKKIEKGTLNENFRTINLKKKVFSRGKKNFTYSKYAVKQWKNKKRLENLQDGNQLACFVCGETGHFAKNCKKSKSDGLLSLDVTSEEECLAGPTLEEAAEMVKTNSCTTRKPTLNYFNSSEVDESTDQNDVFSDSDTEELLMEALRLEEKIANLDVEKYVDSKQTVEPYYNLNQNGSIIGTPPEVFEALEKFGFTSFRKGQEEAIMRILSGKSTLVTLSTGSGKSLCYQLPAYLYAQKQRCISLIISPLVSLMEDQVTGIPKFLKAACLHTNKTKQQHEKIMEAIESGDLDILLVSPEAVVSGEKSTWFGSFLRKLPPIAFACIDEAHCVSQWSHNFRPSYLMLCHVLREKIGITTILGLTATATRATVNSIIEHLRITDGDKGVISDIPVPNNLHLTVSRDHQRDNALLGFLSSEKIADYRSIIIYCTRREECNRIASFLRTCLQSTSRNNSNNKRKRPDVEIEPYHAGLPASRRRTIQNNFMSNKLRIVVATVAFGMGINKSDIRCVIHYNMPKNFESYVQEIGRAGRDGLPAHCHLFLDSRGNDEIELRRHIYANSIDRHVIRKLLEKIFIPCSCKSTCPKHEVAFSIEDTVKFLDLAEENISTLLCYLELHKNKYIELLSPAYIDCKIISYGGHPEIKKVAMECPPLAMAYALNKDKIDSKSNIFEFNVMEIASGIGWDSGICKHKLKNLEWTTVNGQSKRSKLNVRFSNLGFRMLAPGNLSPDQLDEALDSIHKQVLSQEKTSLLQLKAIYQSLSQVAAENYRKCLLENSDNQQLKLKIRNFFEEPDPLSTISDTQEEVINEDLIISNIRGLISSYRDNNFTGRAVARIFHGIPSPNYPAYVWGKSKYWRCMLDTDFNTIHRLANKEILYFK